MSKFWAQAAALPMLFLATPAISGGYTTITQNFESSYQWVGSIGDGFIQQYSGPLTLRSVKIEWWAYVGSSYNEGNPDLGTAYQQHYQGYAGIFLFDEDIQPPFYYNASKGFSGFATCYDTSCAVGGGVSGSHIFSAAELNAFIGTDYLTVRGFGDISPYYGDGEFTSSSSGASGTVTYTLSDGVPEPASWAMMVGGFALIGGALRYRPRFRMI